MYTIGDFARLGGVSVRMLRHYDGIGLLVPARVDPASGYRFYAGDQLARLDRLLALTGLGFTLEQCRAVLDDAVTPEELRGMLRLRRAELEDRIATDRERLDRVERRLRALEGDGTMSDLLSPGDVRVAPVAGHHLAALTATAASLDDVGGVVGPLFDRLAGTLAAAGVAMTGPAVATYTYTPGGSVEVLAGIPVGGPVPDGVETVDLPPVDHAAAFTHHGPMETIGDSWQALLRRCAADGLELDGSAREVYLHMPTDDPASWVTELQQPVRAR